MNRYTDIRHISVFPSFHDAELIGIRHDTANRVLELCLRRVAGKVETLRFSGIVAQRMIDFAAQNVASRLLVSPHYVFSLAEIQYWIPWLHSRDDAKAAAISNEKAREYARDLKTARRVLFVLEPSCGAELAVLCESVALEI